MEALDAFAKSYPAGTVLFEEGDFGSRMFVVKSGKVKILKRIGGTEVTLAVVGSGDFFGEMAILEGLPRSAAAITMDDCVLIEVDQNAFEILIKKGGEISIRLLRRLSGRLREANRQIQAFLSHDGAARAVEILRAAAATESDGQGNRRLALLFSRADVAPRVGLSLSETEQVVARLVRAGVLVERPGGLWIAPEETLEDFLLYLELQSTYDPITTSELAEISGLPEDEVHKIVRRVLSARLDEDGGEEGQKLADTYQTYLKLKARFEYSGQV